MNVEIVSKITLNDYYWKWAIITMHNCLQSFMVLALQGTNSVNIIRTRDRERWIDAYNNNLPYPKTQLKTINELFDSLTSGAMNQYIHSKVFVPESKHIGAIDIINSVRNNFIHFQPMGLSLQKRIRSVQLPRHVQ
jgi:hypothetical protein